MGEKIALGTDQTAKAGSTEMYVPRTDKEMLNIISMRIDEITKRLNNLQDLPVEEIEQAGKVNSDGLTIGNSLIGVSTRNGTHILTIAEDGYYIGPTKYGSLSSAAEASSGVRRSGWTYWKFPDGKTIKEALGKV